MLRQLLIRSSLIVLAIMASASACAAPSVDELAAVLWRYNEAAQHALPIPDNDSLTRIAAGDMVHLREKLDQEEADGDQVSRLRVVGFQVVERPRLLVWLATLYSETQHDSRLLEHRVGMNAHGSSVWYQHLNTPWPVRNRHWVIHNSKNTALADATQGLVWEHRWRLADGGRDIALNLILDNTFEHLDEKDYEGTIYLNENVGAWTMFEVDAHTTLVVAHTMADMGGWIPDRWVASFARRQLGGVLRTLAPKSDRIHERYKDDKPVFDGFGRPISSERIADLRRRLRISQDRAASAPNNTNAQRK